MRRVPNPELQQSLFDAAMIRIDRCNALATLLATEDVASAFANLSAPEQAAIFGTFEAALQEARDALLYTLTNKH
jgi:hypothetical protein